VVSAGVGAGVKRRKGAAASCAETVAPDESASVVAMKNFTIRFILMAEIGALAAS